MTRKNAVSRLELFPPHAGINGAGHLAIGGCDTVALAGEYGTPLYVFDEAGIRDRCREFRREFGDRYPDVTVLYACKAFTSLAMLRLVAEEGLGLDAVSGGELGYARAAGFPMEKVSFPGNNKSAAELELAIGYGIGHIVVDNPSELDRLRGIAGARQVAILLRLAPGIDPHTHRYNTTGTADSKFGFTRPTWDGAVQKALAAPNLNLLGLHFHIGSGLQATEPYGEAIDVVLEYAAEIRDKYRFELNILSVGGGFGTRYQPEDTPPTIAAFAEAITGRLRQRCAGLELPLPKLIVEPGRSIVAENGVALYTVGVIKEIPGIRTYVSVDGGMGDNIRQPLYGYVQTALIANRPAAENTRTVTIAGKYCESGDILIPEATLPEMHPGDILAVAGSGAYAIPLSSNYNAACRPAVVFARDGEARLIRRRETLDDLTRRDIL